MASVMIVGESWGAHEKRLGRPFVGPSGFLLDAMLASAGIPRHTVHVTNVVNDQPPGNDVGLWWTTNKAQARRNELTIERAGAWFNDLIDVSLTALHEEVANVRPECIVALGNLALWALTGETGIGKWRGSEMAYAPPGGPIPTTPITIVPTFHPAYVLRVFEWKHWVVHDLRKRVVGKLGHDRAEPRRRFCATDDFSANVDILYAMRERDGWLAADVETRRGRIECVGLGTAPNEAVCIPFQRNTGARLYTQEQENELGSLVKELLTSPKVRIIGQNFNYDAQYFTVDPVFAFTPRVAFDTMCAQHVLLPGTPKDLVHLSSVYCKFHRWWKDDLQYDAEAESVDDAARWYGCMMDCAVTWEVAHAQMQQLRAQGLWR